MNAHSYALLKTIMASAVAEGKAALNPCVIPGAGNAKRASKTKPATLEELETIVAEMPERYQAMVLLASWCAMRFGELTELRRGDIDFKDGIIAIRMPGARSATSTRSWKRWPPPRTRAWTPTPSPSWPAPTPPWT